VMYVARDVTATHDSVPLITGTAARAGFSWWEEAWGPA